MIRTMQSKIKNVISLQRSYKDVLDKIDGFVSEIVKSDSSRLMNVYPVFKGGVATEWRLSVNEVYFGKELAGKLQEIRFVAGKRKPSVKRMMQAVKDKVTDFVNENI